MPAAFFFVDRGPGTNGKCPIHQLIIPQYETGDKDDKNDVKLGWSDWGSLLVKQFRKVVFQAMPKVAQKLKTVGKVTFRGGPARDPKVTEK